MRFEAVAELLKARGESAFRLDQIAYAVYQEGVGSFADIAALPKALREELSAKVPLLSFAAERVLVSGDGSAQKAVLKLRDGCRIETVLMRPKPGRRTACLSSQVGCALGCTFCATGLMGFIRDLSEEEITDQVLFWRQRLRAARQEPLSNVVYMGMGEPFLNLENVCASLAALTDPKRFGFGARRLSVSTAGVVPGIERLGRDFPQVNLALSLHAATDERRLRLVPLNKAYNLSRLREALRGYLKSTNRKVFIEYTLLRGENDGLEHAAGLVRFLRTIAPLRLLHVNLIVWNPTATPHRAAQAEDVRGFKERLRSAGVPVTIRKNLGLDIEGACGQLATAAKTEKTRELGGGSSV